MPSEVKWIVYDRLSDFQLCQLPTEEVQTHIPVSKTGYRMVEKIPTNQYTWRCWYASNERLLHSKWSELQKKNDGLK